MKIFKFFFIILFLSLISCQHNSFVTKDKYDLRNEEIKIKGIATSVYLESYKVEKPIPESEKFSKERSPASLSSICRKMFRGISGLFDESEMSHPILRLKELNGEDLVNKYDEIIDEKDMFSLWRKTRRKADEVTETTMKYLEQPIESTSDTRVPHIDQLQANRVYRAVEDHPVASQCHLRKYDPQGNIGFCFGRAMTAHLELLNSGVQKDKIRKLWAVGHFKTGSASWRYHVTTIVQSPNGSWWAIDPVMGSTVRVELWLKIMKGYDVGGDMVLLTSKAKRFGPSSPKQYKLNDLNNGSYNDYFKDLLRSYRENGGPFNGEVFKPANVTSWLNQTNLFFKLSFSH